MYQNYQVLAGNIKHTFAKALFLLINYTKKVLFQLSFIFLLVLLNSIRSVGQIPLYETKNSIPVKLNSTIIPNAWSGGLNAALINSFDLNGDNIDDLVILDKTSSKISTFLFKNGHYEYAPSYELYFPKITDWLILKDYNCDGKKDIFTSGDFTTSISVYTNKSTNNGLNWELTSTALNTSIAGGSIISIECNSTDYPGIEDIDNDGDLDIVSYDGLGASALCLYLNRSKEIYGNCDNLTFEKYSSCYGKFTIGFSCNNLVSLNQTCFGYGGTNDNARQMHSGSSIGLLDLNNDGNLDILLGDVGCNSVYALYNGGSSVNAIVSTVNPAFPTNDPINLENFPATFYLDIDNDGLKDLLVTPNLYENENFLTDFSSSIWLYKNIGTNTLPNFSFLGKNFLQNDMIDVGERANPVLYDVDKDGILDLLIANRGKVINGKFTSTIQLFKNIGTIDSAQFELVNADYINFSNLNLYDLRISIGKVDENNSDDLYFIATDTLGFGKTFFIPNSNLESQALNFSISNIKPLNITAYRSPPNNEQIFDSFTKSDYLHIFDYKGAKKLLFGTKDGPIQVYGNSFVDGLPNFTYESNNFLNTTDNDFRRTAIKPIAIIKPNDSLDVYTLDNSGQINVYRLSSLYDNNFTKYSSILLDKTNDKVQSSNFGSAATFTLGDLNKDFLLDIIVGTKGGGILHLKNVFDGKIPSSLQPVPSKRINKPYSFYPNPTESTLYFESTEKCLIEILDVMGNTIKRDSYETLSNTQSLNMNDIHKGIYHVKISSKIGIFFEKLFIND